MRSRISLLNIIYSVMMQLAFVVSAFILPRMILKYFGSETNGLVSSINQFLNYIVLAEGGLSSVIAANLYKPLTEHNDSQLSKVLVTSKNFYKKIGLIFIVYALLLACVYPVVVDSNYSYVYVFALILVLAVNLLMKNLLSATSQALLNADKKTYVISVIAIVLTVANIISVIVFIKCFKDILIVKIVTSVLFIGQPVFQGIYIKKHYNVNWHAQNDNSLIKQRWNGFAVNIALFIHTSVDVVLLTLMSDLNTVSVYSVYALVITKISVLISSISSGIEPTIGQAYANNDSSDLNQKFNLYVFIITVCVGIVFTVTGLTITPFIQLYTKSITDANYYQPLFGYIFALSEAVYLLRIPYISLASVANKFKEMTIPAYIESGINIVLSLILLRRFGLVGIAIGTLAGMVFRCIYQIWLTSKIIPSCTQWKSYSKLLIVALTSCLSVLICKLIVPFAMITVKQWILNAFCYTCICSVLFGLMSLVCFKKELLYIKKYLRPEVHYINNN